MLNLRPFELFLIEFAFYTLLWLINDYVASLLSLVFAVICIAILLVAIIAELIEPSKVPRKYYYYMIVSIAAPILAGWLFISLMGGQLDWFEGF